MGSGKNNMGDGSAGKIFIGGLAKETTLEQFVNYFGNYGEITDSVILKDRQTGRPRGFGFITYADPSVVNTVIAEIHVINGKQVEIKKTTPKGSSEPKVFKTKKIFVGGIPPLVTEDELESFFSKFGKVVEHQIIKDQVTQRSRGFGFVVFDSDQVVDGLLMNGNMIDIAGTKVEIKKAEPKKPSNSAPAPRVFPNSSNMASFGPFLNSNSSFGPFMYNRPNGGRFGECDSGYRVSDYVGYRGESSVGYSSRLGNYAEPNGFVPYPKLNSFGPCDCGYNSGIRGGVHGNRGGYVDTRVRYHPYLR